MSRPILDTELHALVDGELDPARVAEVEAALAADPALGRQVAAFRADKLRIARVYGALIDRPLPDTLLRALSTRKRDARPAWYSLAAAAAVLLMLGLIAWQWVPSGGDPLLAEALELRSGTIQPLQELPADASAETRDRLLATTLEQNVTTPDLAKEGFQLAGIGLYPNRTLRLTYRDARAHVLTLMLKHGTGHDRYVIDQHGALSYCVQETDILTAVMVGEMPEREMAKVYSLAYKPLDL